MCDDEMRWCKNLEVGEILTPIKGSWVFNYGTFRCVIIKILDRGDITPLLTVVDQNFKIHDYDAAHFYIEPVVIPVKELTVAEISKKLGYTVKVVE